MLTKTMLGFVDFHLVVDADFTAVWDSCTGRTGGVESGDQRVSSMALLQWATDTGMKPTG